MILSDNQQESSSCISYWFLFLEFINLNPSETLPGCQQDGCNNLRLFLQVKKSLGMCYLMLNSSSQVLDLADNFHKHPLLTSAGNRGHAGDIRVLQSIQISPFRGRF